MITISKFGLVTFFNKNMKKHRNEDLPAVTHPDGSKYWFKNGLNHRDNDLPSVMWDNGYIEFWSHGLEAAPPPPPPKKSIQKFGDKVYLMPNKK